MAKLDPKLQHQIEDWISLMKKDFKDHNEGRGSTYVPTVTIEDIGTKYVLIEVGGSTQWKVEKNTGAIYYYRSKISNINIKDVHNYYWGDYGSVWDRNEYLKKKSHEKQKSTTRKSVRTTQLNPEIKHSGSTAKKQSGISWYH